MKKIKLHYYIAKSNFGDALNINLLESLFNVKVEHGTHTSSDFTAIGSVLESFLRPKSLKFMVGKLALPKLNIYGSGFIKEAQPNNNHFFFRKNNVLATRGKYTLQRMQYYTGKKLNNVALGDPALLLPKIQEKSNTKYDLGIIAHYVDKDSNLINQIKELIPNSKIIDIQQTDTYQFVNELTSCDRIISSAMHPLIVADAYGIPSARMILSDKLFSNGGNYKFDDYYSAFHSPKPKVFDLRESQDLNFTKEEASYAVSCTNDELLEIQDKLIQAFPYKH